MAQSGPRGVLARGLGRSYGDAAQNAGGTVIDGTAAQTGIHAGRRRAGHRPRATAGVSLDDLMRAMLPFGLVRARDARHPPGDGRRARSRPTCTARATTSTAASPTTSSRSRCTPPPARWTVTRRVRPRAVLGHRWRNGTHRRDRRGHDAAAARCETSMIRAENVRCPDLDSVMAAMTRGRRRRSGTRRRGSTASRRARHSVVRSCRAATTPELDDLPAEVAARPAALRPARQLSAPPWAPNGLLNRVSIAAFNELWFRVARAARRHGVETISSFFHPLDGVRDWNRLYGSRGFLQYQYVVPDARARHGAPIDRDAQRGRGRASFLAVLKRFGPGNPGTVVVPPAGLDPRARHPGDRARPRRAARPARRAGGSRPVGASTWPRTRDCAPSSCPSMYPELDRFAALRARVDPDVRAPVRPAAPPLPPLTPPAFCALRGVGDHERRKNKRRKAMTCRTRSDRCSRCWCSGVAPTSRWPRVRELVERRARTIVLAARDPGALRRARPRSCARSVPQRSRPWRSTPTTPAPTPRSSTTCSAGSATSTSRSSPSACSATRSEAEHDGARRGRHRHRELRRRGLGDRAHRAADARPGPRHDRRAVVGGRGTGPALELRVRIVEGGHGRVLPGPRRHAWWAAACG